jgi:hypothetical protein
MAFPSNPVDQQVAVVNNVKYIYSVADNSWTKTGEVSGFQVDGNLTVTGNAVVTAGVYADEYFYANGAPFAGGGSGVLNNWTLITANYTAGTGDRILANTAAGSFTITLPAAPALGENVQITDAYNFGENSLIIDPNGSTIEGQAVELEVNISALDLELVYSGDTWQLITTIGPQGLQGNTGYTGSAGADGTIGVDGYTGSQGDIGYTGSEGIQGNVGYTGSEGQQGIQGAIGYTGSEGQQGITGYTGSQGVQGEIGYTGSEGQQGPIGYTGSAGADGTIGVDGYTGSQGDIGYTGSAGADGTSANIQVLDANVAITNTVTSINFIGSGVAATAVDGNVTVVVPGLLIDGASSLNFVRSFTGNGATTAYNLQGTILDAAQLMVHVDGIYQIPGVNFTANAEWINFSAATDANAEIVIQSYTSALLAEPLIAGSDATTANTQPSVLDTFSSTDYRTAKYIISAAAAGEYQASEVLVTHDDTTAYITVYAVLTTGNSEIITFSANLVSSNVELYGTTVSGDSQVKLQRTYVRV